MTDEARAASESPIACDISAEAVGKSSAVAPDRTAEAACSPSDRPEERTFSLGQSREKLDVKPPLHRTPLS
jgi:hypothetical protein